MKMRVIFPAALAFIFFSVVGIGAEDLVGERAPEISAETWINTEALSLVELEGGVVVVEFWATWCGPCLQAIPHMRELNEQFDQVTFVSLTNENNESSDIESFVEEHDMDYPVGAGSETFREYGVKGIPNAFIIDREGTVVWNGHPLSPEFEETLRRAVEGEG